MVNHRQIKICFFSKYPPIEGGVSSRTYWLVRALGERGIEVHIVTNALEVEENYRETIDFENPEDLKEYQPKNVFVHSLKDRMPIHIPFSLAYFERLINLGAKVVKDFQCDLIDSHYLQPYGLAAVFTKLLTSKPCILRHAGSDITRLFFHRELHDLYDTAFKIADVIATNPRVKKILGLDEIPEEKLWFRQFFGANPKFFNPAVEPANLEKLGVPAELLKGPILTFLGKYSAYKGLLELIKAASEINEDFLLLFITGGRKLEEFREYLKEFPSLDGKYYISKFLPPWQIPAILRASTCLLHLETDFPIKMHTPYQPSEALASGTPLLMSEEIFRRYKAISPGLERDKHVLVTNPKNRADLENALLKIIQNPDQIREIGRKAYQEIFDKNQFERALENQISLYQKLLEISVSK